MPPEADPAHDRHRTLRFHASDLRRFVVCILTAHDVPHEEAGIVADVLVSAERRGIPSHGMGRLSLYSRRLREGKIHSSTKLVTVRESSAALCLDAGQGWGHVAGHHAMQRCIEKAKGSGICIATVRRSTHFGIAAHYAMMPLEHGMIGFAATNTRPHVAPTFGRAPTLGTNPLSLAAPALHERPFVLDMSTSTVAMGRIKLHEAIQQPLPAAWGIDDKGDVCLNPGVVLEQGALLPLGGFDETSGYKGYGLAFLVDILSGVLAGAGFGPLMPHEHEESGPNIGHTFAAVDIEAFRPIEDFLQDMDRLIQAVRSSPKEEGSKRIYVAGEKEFEQAEQNDRLGIPLMPHIVNALQHESARLGLPFDLTPID